MQIVPDFFEMEPDMEDWCPQHTLLLPLELVSTVSFCRHTSKPKSPSRTVRTTGLPEKWEFEKEAAKLFVLSLMTAMSAGFIVFIFYCVFFVWYCWTLGPKCIFFFLFFFWSVCTIWNSLCCCFVRPFFSCVRELGHKADVHFVHFQSPPCAYKHKDVE